MILAELNDSNLALLYVCRCVPCVHNDENHLCMYNEPMHYSKFVNVILKSSMSQDPHCSSL